MHLTLSRDPLKGVDNVFLCLKIIIIFISNGIVCVINFHRHIFLNLIIMTTCSFIYLLSNYNERKVCIKPGCFLCSVFILIIADKLFIYHLYMDKQFDVVLAKSVGIFIESRNGNRGTLFTICVIFTASIC